MHTPTPDPTTPDPIGPDPATPRPVAHPPAYAVDLARERLAPTLRVGLPVLVGVTGPQGAGKSTIARRLAASLDAIILHTDDYQPDFDRIPVPERDEPRHADLDRLEANLLDLAAGRPTSVPSWCFRTHRRIGERPVGPARTIVAEGLHALNPRIAPLLHLRLLVDAPAEVRLRRVLERERERGWTPEQATEHFRTVAEPIFDRLRPTYLASADLVIDNTDTTDTAPHPG